MKLIFDNSNLCVGVSGSLVILGFRIMPHVHTGSGAQPGNLERQPSEDNIVNALGVINGDVNPRHICQRIIDIADGSTRPHASY